MTGAPIPIRADGDLIALCRRLLESHGDIIPIDGWQAHFAARDAAARYLAHSDNHAEANRLVRAALKKNEKK